MGLGLASTFLPVAGRPASFLWPLATGLVILLLVRPRFGSAAEAFLGTFIGLLPALVLLGAIHDVAPVVPPLPISSGALLLIWALTSATLGREVAQRVAGRTRMYDASARILAVLLATGYVAGALLRLLLPGSTTADRLSWTLGEEDNAQIVGIAREVLTGGPTGAELANQYGTAFINLPLVLTRLFGGTPIVETDPRMQAISVFTISTIVVIALAGVAMALIAAIPHHVHSGSRDRPLTTTTVLAGAIGSGLSALIGFSLLVVLPMRTGFLTFTWGLTLVILGAALLLIIPSDASALVRIVVVVHLVGLTVLLLSSWPFIAPALGPLLLAPLLWVRWAAVQKSLRKYRQRWAVGAVTAVGAIAALLFWFSRWGPATEVLSYGLDILLIGASGIGADQEVRWASWAATALAGTLALALAARGSKIQQLLGIVGPVAGGGLLYIALWTAAAVLTDGVLNYSGIKLLYGVITLATVLGLTALVSQSTRLGAAGTSAAMFAVLLLHQASGTASLHTTWWDRTAPRFHAHSEASIEALRNTSPDVPIRCLPTPGTPVTDTSQWAAYTCVRWMEDAFNESRFHGHRFTLLGAEGETFEPTIERILAESPSEYLFAYRFTLGPGWFGWSGRN
jgi:hypothetical protein